MEHIYRKSKDGEFVKGVALPAFLHNGDYYLMFVRIYEDGLIDCNGLVDFKGFEKKVNESWVVTKLPESELVTVSFHNLFKVEAKNIKTFIDKKDFIDEVRDELEVLQGKKSSKNRCFDAFVKYLKDPSNENRCDLEAAYNRVPSHKRRSILGDMDLKDFPIKEIILKKEINASFLNEWRAAFL